MEAVRVTAFTFTTFRPTQRQSFAINSSTKESTADVFSAFAESLNEDELFTDDQDAAEDSNTWQESLEMLLDPSTPAAKRQILLSDLVNANDDIRSDVQGALKDRKVSLRRVSNSCETSPKYANDALDKSSCFRTFTLSYIYLLPLQNETIVLMPSNFTPFHHLYPCID